MRPLFFILSYGVFAGPALAQQAKVPGSKRRSITCFRADSSGPPAHTIPGVLNWFDRSDIAGLNAPRPVVLHFGERDTPSKDNYSASYNETVPEAIKELKAIYAAVGAADNVSLFVSKGKVHEMDIEALVEFMKGK